MSKRDRLLIPTLDAISIPNTTRLLGMPFQYLAIVYGEYITSPPLYIRCTYYSLHYIHKLLFVPRVIVSSSVFVNGSCWVGDSSKKWSASMVFIFWTTSSDPPSVCPDQTRLYARHIQPKKRTHTTHRSSRLSVAYVYDMYVKKDRGRTRATVQLIHAKCICARQWGT